MAETLRPPASPMPEDLEDLMDIALGNEPNERPVESNRLRSDSVDEGWQFNEAALGLSQSELALHKFLFNKKTQEDKAKKTLDAGSSEYKVIRDQILEELEWQRQGILNSLPGNDDELKKFRLQLGAKRGWDAIRSYIQSLKDNKQHQAAKKSWSTMFKVARDAAAVEDKTLLDLYQRYGFLGWDRRAPVPPHNPMFPDKNVKLAKERAFRLQQMAIERELDMLSHVGIHKDKVNAAKLMAKLRFSSTTRALLSNHDGRCRSPTRGKFAEFFPSTGSENGGGLTRSVTLLSLPTSPRAPKLRRERTQSPQTTDNNNQQSDLWPLKPASSRTTVVTINDSKEI